jgi:hypothetical protein
MLGGVYAVLAATGQRLTRKNANANAKANYTAKHTNKKKTKLTNTTVRLNQKMKALTDLQVNEINRLLLEIEKSDSNKQAIVYAEKIRAILLQAEHVTLKLEQ